MGPGVLAQAREKEGLVDPTVEDRDAQLNALDDYISAFQPGLTGELAGRQVICHRILFLLCRWLHGKKYAASTG
jgi:hypothetical protein